MKKRLKINFNYVITVGSYKIFFISKLACIWENI
jgi:hypothetical protein